MIFFWFHTENKPISFNVDFFDRIDKNILCHKHDMGIWNMHMIEPSQNTADWYHFKTVHSLLLQDHRTSFPLMLITIHIVVMVM